ncbi:Fido domain-containing protein [Mycena venus]|uniref:Fido domain-containing protein n=1 Tax=Mycena venus TaxID=2733690 RepID=A0A8H7DA10_9AGAR|nr:Fido domain-containing protein [Mycena venus]
MAAHRMAKIFTPTYVSRVNAQLVYPAPSQLVKPHELLSALAKPSNVAYYEPERDVSFLAASLAYGLILGTPIL